MYAESRKGKRITVFINGYRFMPGTEVTVNQHDYPILERVKSFLTQRCPHPYGGRYKEIFTMSGQVVRDIEDLENGNEYIASKDRVYRQPGNNLRYTDIQPLRPIWRKGQFKKNDFEKTITPVLHQPKFRQTEGKAFRQGQEVKGVRIEIHRNGDFTSAPLPFLIDRSKTKSVMALMIKLQDVLGIPAVKLFKTINDGGCYKNFLELRDEDMATLVNGDHIVVVEKASRKLTPKVYHKRNNFDTSSSPRASYRSVSPPRRKQFSKTKPLPSIGSSNQSQADAMSPYSNATSYGGGRRSNKSKGNNRDYDTDEGGVFRAKKQNNAQGAHQVNDSRETRTEKPIDQREAEVVDEEEIHSKEKTTPIPPGTELNKRPSKETKQNSDNGSQTKSKIEERVNEEAGQQ